MSARVNPTLASGGEMSEAGAISYLKSLLHKTFRISIKDGRLFVGGFECTDKQSNIILAGAYEYCPPSQKTLRAAAEGAQSGNATIKADMTSRYLGLIVVPGEHITKIEVEEEESSTETLPTPESEISIDAAADDIV